MLIANLLSQNSFLRLLKMFLIQKCSHITWAIDLYSTYEIDLATTLCFLPFQVNKFPVKNIQNPPNVLTPLQRLLV